MITEIEIEGFKSLEEVRLKLGRLNLFVGTNASGKSNFFEALRFLQGVGYGFTIDEILNGKPKGAFSEVWEAIRGGSRQVSFARRRRRGRDLVRPVRLSVEIEIRNALAASYSLAFSSSQVAVEAEALVVDAKRVFERERDHLVVQGRFGEARRSLFDHKNPTLPSLARSSDFSEADRQAMGACSRSLSNMQRLDFDLEVLRDYSQSRTVSRIGEHGENFAAVVKSIQEDQDLRLAYLSWLKQLTPSELDEVTVLGGALGESLFAVKQEENIFPAPVLSDGTLRFAAIAAAFFQPDMPDIIMLEEIENGIHPSRLRLLLELLKSQSGGPDRSGPQVFATTHSPLVLTWLDESDYATTFLCKRDEETGASIIRPLSEIPRFVELVKTQPIGDLFAEGWLETAL